MSYRTRTFVRFGQVDPAGIVFYPRYFEMLNAALEDWFSEAVGVDFATLHLERQIGVPTVKLNTEFHHVSRLGDALDIAITPAMIGNSSCTLRYVVSGNGVVRLTAEAVIVCMDLTTARPLPWPDDIRSGVEALLQEPAPAVLDH